LLGGTPAVWSTCMVFFQAALLAGYAYAHASIAWLGVRRQAMLHVAVLALPLAVLPLGVNARLMRGGDANPVLDVLLLLSRPVGPSAGVGVAPGDAAAESLTWPRRLSWVVLAFVPSSLLLGTTTYITTDIAAIPLLWALPLAIYLLSFIVAFGRWSLRLHRVVLAIVPPVVLAVLFLMVSAFAERIWVTVLWHFLMLFVVALACHGELALDRPPPRHLTEFYLLVSAGGVPGGLCN